MAYVSPTIDAGYKNLVGHLRNIGSGLELSDLQRSLSHFLALSSPPTALTAAAVASPHFGPPLSYIALSTLYTAFRQAIYLKHVALKDEGRGLFTRSIGQRLREWTDGILEGMRGSIVILRLAATGGLLQGLQDIAESADVKGKGSLRPRLENEVVVQVAEVVDLYYAPVDGWEKEFQPKTISGEVDALSLSMILASQIILLVPDKKLDALPIADLTRIVMNTITTAFRSGHFLADISSAIRTDSGKIAIPPNSSFATDILSTGSSSSIVYMGVLSRFASRLLERSALSDMWHAFSNLGNLARSIDRDWSVSPLAAITADDDIAEDSRQTTTNIWVLLKAALFSTLMITESALSASVFIPPLSYEALSSISDSSNPTPALLAASTLWTFYHLSFVITHLGGVTTTSKSTFPELKKAFYTALDVLASDKLASRQFILDLCEPQSDMSQGRAHVHPVEQGRRAFVLACMEQLVPVLDADTIKLKVVPYCLPHLSDPAHRETYESAHSVMLGIFAAHAEAGPVGSDGDSFTEHLVPFYAECLVENSKDACLSSSQLSLAFSSLVLGSSPPLTQLALSKLLDALPSAPSPQRHRLQLALIASISSVPLALLPDVMTQVESAVSGEQDGEKRHEMVEAAWKEILESVADAEKDWVMRWWYDNRAILAADSALPQYGDSKEDEEVLGARQAKL